MTYLGFLRLKAKFIKLLFYIYFMSFLVDFWFRFLLISENFLPLFLFFSCIFYCS